jgi:hypothetical protein
MSLVWWPKSGLKLEQKPSAVGSSGEFGQEVTGTLARKDVSSNWKVIGIAKILSTPRQESLNWCVGTCKRCQSMINTFWHTLWESDKQTRNIYSSLISSQSNMKERQRQWPWSLNLQKKSKTSSVHFWQIVEELKGRKVAVTLVFSLEKYNWKS